MTIDGTYVGLGRSRGTIESRYAHIQYGINYDENWNIRNPKIKPETQEIRDSNSAINCGTFSPL